MGQIMTLDQLKLLADSGVELDIVAEPAVLQRGYWVNVRRGYDLSRDPEPLTTRRDTKHHRLFKSLDAVFSIVVLDLGRSFLVEGRSDGF